MGKSIKTRSDVVEMIEESRKDPKEWRKGRNNIPHGTIELLSYIKPDNDGYGKIKKTNLPRRCWDGSNGGVSRGLEKYFDVKKYKENGEDILELNGILEEFNYYIPPPPSVRNAIRSKPGVLYGGSNPEADHRYSLHMELYEDEDFRNDLENWNPAEKTLNAKKREVEKKQKEALLAGNIPKKNDNRSWGCNFITTIGNTDLILDRNNLYNGQFIVDPIKTRSLDRKLLITYYDLFKSYTIYYDEFIDKHIDKINELVINGASINNCEINVKTILGMA